MYIANKKAELSGNFFHLWQNRNKIRFQPNVYDLYVCFWQDHVANDCKSCAIDCTLCDKKGILRGKLKEHQDAQFGDCEGTKAVCPFGILGCETREVMGEYYSVFSILFFSSKLRLIMKLFLESSNYTVCPVKWIARPFRCINIAFACHPQWTQGFNLEAEFRLYKCKTDSSLPRAIFSKQNHCNVLYFLYGIILSFFWFLLSYKKLMQVQHFKINLVLSLTNYVKNDTLLCVWSLTNPYILVVKM